VYNLTEVMQHKHVLEELLFKVGDGTLSHYLYNYRMPEIKGNEIGIILV